MSLLHTLEHRVGRIIHVYIKYGFLFKMLRNNGYIGDDHRMYVCTNHMGTHGSAVKS